jgi:hypothetical protein
MLETYNKNIAMTQGSPTFLLDISIDDIFFFSIADDHVLFSEIGNRGGVVSRLYIML